MVHERDREGGIPRGHLSRRGLLAGATLAVTAPALAACARSGSAYSRAVAQTWRPFDGNAMSPVPALHRELIRYATLAPSSHNTQCWKFTSAGNRISILPDYARRCPVVDPDDHHLFVSLGCATENLVIAALANGLRANVSFDRAAGPTVHVDFESAKAVASASYDAIPKRQCTRGVYDGRPLETAELRALEAATAGGGVHVLFLTSSTDLERVRNFVTDANSAQLNDPAFRKELLQWIRFSDDEAAAERDGLFSRASGSPSVPRWLAAPFFNVLLAPKSDNEKYRRFIRSSAGIAVFIADASDPEHWVETGRRYERFVLQATAMGVRTAMLNQPVEVATLRPHFAAAIGIGKRRPDLVVRFGRGPEMPRSLRRSVEAVIVA
jgi:hypothetical protein